MCGIVGVIQRYQPVDRLRLIYCRDQLTYRGPDDAGVWISSDQRVGLAHRRLSIVDLTAHGHQPMLSQDGRYCLVFNGEIYNYKQLRVELKACGHFFYGHGDTEVLLAAYQQWGEGCLQRLNGMFAFAIYDAGVLGGESPSVFLARDRAGKKPLYYHQTEKSISFASELKGLAGGFDLDIHALNDYLALGYVPHDRCLAQGVSKLPAAHAARIDINTMQMHCWRYWSLPENRPDAAMQGEDYANEAERLLIDAVRLRLHCDVPSGVLLSGGLDSGLVVAAAAKVSSKPVQTFTISFPGSNLDESSIAARVAEYHGTDHHVLPLATPSLSIMEDIAPYIDEPIADSSLIPAWAVSQLTRQHVTVALGGDGGDELFGGYGDYTTALKDARSIGFLPKPCLRGTAWCASLLSAGVRGRNRLSSLRGGVYQQLIWGTPYFDKVLRKRVLDKEALMALGSSLEEPELFQLSLFKQGCDPIDSMTRTHFSSILADDFLVKVDRASMYHSLEMRAPLLDYRLIEFAFGCIPSKWKAVAHESRRIQRILARRMLPLDIDYTRKQGFSIPLDDWLRQDKCRILRDYLYDLPAIIRQDSVDELIKGQLQGRANGSRLFSLMMLSVAAKNNGWR